jgi:hypothetical protein
MTPFTLCLYQNIDLALLNQMVTNLLSQMLKQIFQDTFLDTHISIERQKDKFTSTFPCPGLT